MCRNLSLMVLCAVIVSPRLLWAGSVSGRRNTAVGLSGATLYHAVKGHPGEAIAFGLGSAFAWQRYEKARRSERSRQRGTTAIHTSSHTRSAGAPRASSASLRAQLAALQEQMTVRQEAMQQNLNELAARTGKLEQTNRALRADRDRTARRANWLLAWSVLATMFLIGVLGWSLHRALHRPRVVEVGGFAQAR